MRLSFDYSALLYSKHLTAICESTNNRKSDVWCAAQAHQKRSETVAWDLGCPSVLLTLCQL